MVTLHEAQDVAQRYAEQRKAVWFNNSVIDRATYWFFAVGHIGSQGVIVDKADGRLHVLGSALSLEDCFWAHEHGFSPEFVALRITRVHDREHTIELLLHIIEEGPPRLPNPNPKRAWLAERIDQLPCEFLPQRLRLSVPALRRAAEQGWFEYQAVDPSTEATPLPLSGGVG
ncbi:hypothetical protein [Sorangium sp. So ce128]|uniref:hypothetical protein n=1 Tax=Sorangium sp. So ce128 TaxID=3133281 RepID=UPI003F633FCE